MDNKYYAIIRENGTNQIVSGSADDVRRKIACADDVRTVHKISGGLPEKVNIQDFRNPSKLENWEHCKRISDELDLYASGTICRCPNCSAEHDLSKAGEKFLCPDCGEISDTDAWETCGMYDYMDDILDIDYVVNFRKEYKACRVLVAYGGPNIYIDTLSGAVELYWWSDHASFPILRSTMAAIDEWAEEYYSCI